MKYELTIEQVQARTAALKKIVASYPESARRESSQVVDVRKDNEKFISPQVQSLKSLKFAKKVQKLNRELEQEAFAQVVLGDIDAVLNRARHGQYKSDQLIWSDC